MLRLFNQGFEVVQKHGFNLAQIAGRGCGNG
jgi:hypothetical protein